MKINKNMIFSSIQFIKKKVKSFKNKKILLLGASYKQDVSDIEAVHQYNFQNILKTKSKYLFPRSIN